VGTVGISLNKEEEAAVAKLLGVPISEGFKAQLLGKKLKAFVVEAARETEEPVKQVETVGGVSSVGQVFEGLPSVRE